MRKFILVLVVLLLIWTVWIQIGRHDDLTAPESALDVMEVIDVDSICTRNIVGIQPYMLATDYHSRQHFYEKLDAYFVASKQAGYFHSNTVVLLPEYLGTWLVVNGEKTSVSKAETITGAMAIMVMSNPIKFVKAMSHLQNESDAVAASIFRMKSETMATIYGDVFKELAKTYQVTINAGSILLPGPTVSDNQINVDFAQPLYNTTFVFHPDGIIDQQFTRKSFPITSELPFVTSYPIDELTVYDLSIGKTVLLVCADSWYPESYERINTLQAEVVLVNSYCAGNNTMASDWRGYDGIRMPDDVDTADITKLKEREAWIKYALPGRIKNTHASVGANVFLRGELWNLGTAGQPFFVNHGKLLDIGLSERAGVWNFCF